MEGDAMRIEDLRPDDEATIHRVAEVLMAGFAEQLAATWPDLERALDEVRQSFGAGRISRVALDDDGAVLGWIGGIAGYDGRVWELHPLVVAPARQGCGVGRELVADFDANGAA
jgi:aminoglycoside 6'-N-acetyltransferase I